MTKTNKPQWEEMLSKYLDTVDFANFDYEDEIKLKEFIADQIAKAYEDGIVDSVKSAIRSFDDGYKEGLQKALELPTTFAEYKFEDPMAPENKRLLQEDFGIGQESGWSHYRHAVFLLLQKEKERA